MTLRLADHCGLYLSERAVMDPSIWVLDGDLADSDGAVHFAERHPERFLMCGIAEQAMVSVAAGMASCGLRPFVFSFAAFLCCRAYDQIRVSVAQARQAVTLIGSHSGGCASRNGKTHAVLNDVALIASLPGVSVWAPAGPAEARFTCRSVLAGSAPAYVRLPRRPLEDLPGEPAPFRWLTEPAPVALMGTGLGTHLASEAQRLLSAGGFPVGLLHCLQLAPLPAGLAEALGGVHTLFVVEDHVRFSGLAARLRELDPPCRIHSVGWPPEWPGQSGDDLELLRLHGLEPGQIAALVQRTGCLRPSRLNRAGTRA